MVLYLEDSGLLSLYLMLINLFDIFLFILSTMGAPLGHDNSRYGSFTMWTRLPSLSENLQLFPEFTPLSLWSSERQKGSSSKINGLSYQVSNRAVQILDLCIRKCVGSSQRVYTGPEQYFIGQVVTYPRNELLIQ